QTLSLYSILWRIRDSIFCPVHKSSDETRLDRTACLLTIRPMTLEQSRIACTGRLHPTHLRECSSLNVRRALLRRASWSSPRRREPRLSPPHDWSPRLQDARNVELVRDRSLVYGMVGVHPLSQPPGSAFPKRNSLF
ncbi:unnamed protein product, partial [Mycena citricolor]